MHSYLKAIGFSKQKSNKETKELIKEVMETAHEQWVISSTFGEKIVEFKKEYGSGFGIIVHAHINENKEPEAEYYFPYVEGSYIQTNEEISIEKHISKNSYAGVCDDLRFGVSLIFYLQNSMDYIKIKNVGKKGHKKLPIIFSALSLEGMVLLPINKSENEIRRGKKALRNRSRLIEAARKGDEDAIEILTIEDLDTYSKISRRVLKEDVFSIVDSSFMPYGIECDQYTVVGNILNVLNIENTQTKEKLYNLTVECHDLVFQVMINKKSLLGEPEPGRRFKGNVWMQGKVDFSQHKNK